MTTRSEKLRQAAIEKYGSWEAFVEIRYRNPKALADAKRAASLGGKASGNRTYVDRKKARESYEKGLGKRRGLS